MSRRSRNSARARIAAQRAAKGGAALESYGIGTIFDYQGRYGAAVKSKEEALKAFRDLNQRDVWLGEILSGLGSSLSLSGRTEEAAKPLDEAMALAKELQNTILTAQTLRLQAERLYYAGDATAAQQLAEQAAQDASKTADKGLSLQAQASAAIAAAALGSTKLNATRLGTLARDADSLGLKALAVTVYIARCYC